MSDINLGKTSMFFGNNEKKIFNEKSFFSTVLELYFKLNRGKQIFFDNFLLDFTQIFGNSYKIDKRNLPYNLDKNIQDVCNSILKEEKNEDVNGKTGNLIVSLKFYNHE